MGRWIALIALGACAHEPSTPASAGPPMQVQVDGAPVWPPQGDGCDALVACCSAMAQVQPAMDLMCQLAAVKGGACVEQQKTVMKVFGEMGGGAAPSACGTP